MDRVDSFLKHAVPRPELLRLARAHGALRRWPEVVGEILAQRARPDRFERGTVWVAVEGSAWAQELRMRKETILSRLTEISGERNLFLDVRFGVRPLPPPGADPVVFLGDAEPEVDYDAMSIREIAERRRRELEADEPLS